MSLCHVFDRSVVSADEVLVKPNLIVVHHFLFLLVLLYWVEISFQKVL